MLIEIPFEERTEKQTLKAGVLGLLRKPFGGQCPIDCLNAALSSQNSVKR
jgi:hypothetical protein